MPELLSETLPDLKADEPLSVSMTAEMRRLELISDLDIPSGVGINTLGNFGSPFRETPESSTGAWNASADASLLHAPERLGMTLASPCRVQVLKAGEVVHQSEQKAATVARMPLGFLLQGEHRYAVRLSSGDHTEEVALRVDARVETFASLPVARRFVKGVDVADGHLTHSFTDLSLKGAGLPLELVRTYSNLSALNGNPFPLGFGWTHTYDSWAQTVGTDKFLIVGGEGSGKVYRSTPATASGNGTGGYHGTVVAKQVGGVYTEIKLTTPAGIEYAYSYRKDARLYLKTIRDPNGNTVRLEYDGRGVLTEVRDGSQRRFLKLTYEERTISNRPVLLLTRVEVLPKDSPQGLTVTYGYDANGNLISVERDRRKLGYAYTIGDSLSPHRLKAFTGPDGAVTGGGTTTFSYKPLPPGAGSNPAARLEIERVAAVTEPDGATTKFEHTLKNEVIDGQQVLVPVLTRITFPGSQVGPTTYHFKPSEPSGMVTRIEQPEARTITFDWLYFDRLLATEEDGSGRQIKYSYSGPGNLVQERLLLKGATAEYQSVTTLEGEAIEEIRTDYTYDRLNRLRTVARRDYTATRKIPVLGVQHRYDGQGNLIARRELQGPEVPADEGLPFPEGGEWKTTFSYDPARNNTLMSKSVLDGEQLRYGGYNDLGQPGIILKRTSPDKELLTRQEFDVRGRLKWTQDELGGTIVRRTEFEYDELDLPTVRRELYPMDPVVPPELAPPSRVTEFTYSPGGLLLEEREKQGAALVFVRRTKYDPMGRVKEVEELPTGTETGDRVLRRTFVYDAMGRVWRETDRRKVVRERTYDRQGRLSRITIISAPGLASPALETEYTYYGGTENIRTIKDYRHHVTTFKYDTLFRVVERTLPIPPPNNVERLVHDTLGNLRSKTDPNGGVTLCRYDALGHKLWQQDAVGNVTVFAYDRDGKLRHMREEATGLEKTFKYDGMARLVQEDEVVPGPAGTAKYTTAHAYDDAKHLVRIQKPSGSVDEYRDGRGLVVKRVVDPGGVNATSLFRYDSLGQLIEQRDPIGATTRYQVDGLGRRRRVSYTLDGGQVDSEQFHYDGEGNVTHHTDLSGTKWSRSYDHLGRMRGEWVQAPDMSQPELRLQLDYDDAHSALTQTDAVGGRTVLRYDGLGRELRIDRAVPGLPPLPPLQKEYEGLNLAAQVDRRGHRTTFWYDALHRLTHAVDPLKRATHVEYEALKRVVTDRRGFQTEILLDARGREVELRRAGRVQWRRSFDAEDRLESSTDAKGAKTTYVYDRAGRLSHIRMPGRTQRFEYNAAGDRVREWLADVPGRKPDRVTDFDLRHRPKSVQDADGNETRYEYDAKGRLKAETDAGGLRTEYAYDPLDKLLKVVRDPGPQGISSTYSFARDKLGRLTRLTDPEGYSMDFAYDALGLRKERSIVPRDPSQPRLSTYFTFDAAGNLEKVAYPDGAVLKHRYDSANRRILSESENPLGANQPYARSMTFEYDEEDNLKKVDATKVWGNREIKQTHVLTYDGFNRLETEVTPHGRKILYGYDENGRLQRLAIEGDKVETRYRYGARGQLEQVEGPLGSAAYEYGSDDRLHTVRLPGGWQTRVHRSANGWVRAIHHFGPGEQPIVSHGYTLNKVGNVRQLEVKAADGSSERRSFDYDALHRLKLEQYGSAPAITYEYDRAGRRRRRTERGDSTSWEYDAYGRLAAVKDAKGTVLEQLVYTPGGLVHKLWSRGSQCSLFYNPLQQLAIAQWGKCSTPGGNLDPSSMRGMTLDYDYRGRRLLRVGLGPADSAYLHAGADRLADLQPARPHATRVRYERGVGLFGLVSHAGSAGPEGLLAMRDRVGSVVCLVHLSGLRAYRQEFTLFGESLRSDLDIPVPVGFAGGWTEPLVLGARTRPVQLGERIYDPAHGRFWAPEPAEPPDDLSLAEEPYAYAHNRPGRFVDPSGWGAIEADSSDAGASDFAGWLFQSALELSGKAAEYVSQWGQAASETAETVSEIVNTAGSVMRDAFETVSALLGNATSDEDGQAMAPSRPAETAESLRPHLRTTPAPPRAEGMGPLRQSEVESYEPRRRNENGVMIQPRAADAQEPSSLLANFAEGATQGSVLLKDPLLERSVFATGASLLEVGIWRLPETVRGFPLHMMAGQNMRWDNTAYDRITGGMIREFYSWGGSNLRNLRDAVQGKAIALRTLIDRNPELDRPIRDVRVLLRTGESVETIQSAATALERTRKARGIGVSVEVGLPGRAGAALRGVGYVSGVVSVPALYQNVREGNLDVAVGDAANIAAAGLTFAAKTASDRALTLTVSGAATAVGAGATAATLASAATVASAGAFAYGVGHWVGRTLVPQRVQDAIGDALYGAAQWAGWK